MIQPDGRLSLTASAFNQLDQYTLIVFIATLNLFFPSGSRNHRCGWEGKGRYGSFRLRINVQVKL